MTTEQIPALSRPGQTEARLIKTQTKELDPQRTSKLRSDLNRFLAESGVNGPEQKAIAEILPAVDTSKNQMFVAPVGSGKTLGLAPELLLGGKDKKAPARVIIVQPTQQLCANASEILAHLYGEDLVGHRYGGLSETRMSNPKGRIQVITTGILWNMLRKGQIKADDYVLFDEIHQTMGFAQTEAAIATLTHQYEQGKRKFGIGMATGTFPSEHPDSKRFLDFAQANLLETKEKSQWNRDLLPGGQDLTQSVKNYLSDSTNNGRNLMVLVPTNAKVAEMAKALQEWPNHVERETSYTWGAAVEIKKPAQKLRVVYFSKDVGAGEFNRQVSDFLRDRARAHKSDQEFNEKLVIVATYGSAGSGVNYPVEDAIGDATYIKAVDEDQGTVRLQETAVSGTILQQAFGRIGRYTHGRFYLVKYNGDRSQEEMLSPEPLPKPLKTSRGLQETLFGLIEAGEDPRVVNSWYSRETGEMKRELEKAYALLATRGLLQEGKVTEIARQLSVNPLTDQDLGLALSVETAPHELRAGLQQIYATEGSASWRALFVKEAILDRENGGRGNLKITDLLLSKGLLRKNAEGQLCMPDSDDTLPDSDTAIILNLAKYLSNAKLETFGSKGEVIKRKLSIGEIVDNYNLSYKALERLFSSLRQAENYNRQTEREDPGYFTSVNWNQYIREIISDNCTSTIEAGFGSRYNHNIISEGIYQDNFTKRYGSPEMVACLSLTKTRGAEARAETTFTGSVLGKVPEDLIPWLPQNLEPRASQIANAYSNFGYANTEKKAELQVQYPHIYTFYNQCKSVADQTSDLAIRGKLAGLAVPTLDYTSWFKEFVLPHMMVQKVDDMAKFEEMLAHLEQSGITVAPQLSNFVSAQTIESIDKDYPKALAVGDIQVELSYLGYGSSPVEIKLPSYVAPISEGRMQFDNFPYTNTFLTALDDQLNQTKIGSTFRISLYGTTYKSIDQLYTLENGALEKAVINHTLRKITDQENEILKLNETTAKEMTEDKLYETLADLNARGIAVVGDKQVGTVIYLHSSTRTVGEYYSDRKSETYFYPVVTTVTKETDPFHSTAYGSTGNGFVSGIQTATLAAYRCKLDQMGEKIKMSAGLVSGEIQQSFTDSWSGLGFEYNFKSKMGEFLDAESKRLYNQATTAQIIDGQLSLPVVPFASKSYRELIDGYFRQVESKLDKLKASQDELANFAIITENGESIPSQITNQYRELLKTLYTASDTDFTEKLQVFVGQSKLLNSQFSKYMQAKTKTDFAPKSFSDWVYEREQALATAPLMAISTPIYFTDYQGNATYTVYTYPDSDGWTQYSLAENLYFGRRKGYGSSFVGRSPREIAEYLGGKYTIGNRGEGIALLNLDPEELATVNLKPVTNTTRHAQLRPIERQQTTYNVFGDDVEEFTPMLAALAKVSGNSSGSSYTYETDEFDVYQPAVVEQVVGPNKHEKNRQTWLELAGKDRTELAKMAQSVSVTDIREAELATVIALVNTPFTELIKTNDPTIRFVNYPNARKRLDGMVREAKRRAERSSGDHIDAQVIETASKLDIIKPATSLAKELIPQWIGDNTELQNQTFTQFLKRLTESVSTNPELRIKIEAYLKQESVEMPAEVEEILIDCVESL